MIRKNQGKSPGNKLDKKDLKDERNFRIDETL